MALRAAIALAWSAVYVLLTVLSKRLMDGVPSGRGLAPAIRHVFSSHAFYLVIALYGVSAGVYLVGLRILPVSVIGPVLTTIGAALSFVVGVLLFDETLSVTKIGGLLVCVVGIILLLSQAE